MKEITISVSEPDLEFLKKIAKSWRKYHNPEDATVRAVIEHYISEDVKQLSESALFLKERCNSAPKGR